MGFKINKQISTSKANVIHQFYDLLAKVAMFPGNVSFLYHKACTYNARGFFLSLSTFYLFWLALFGIDYSWILIF